MAMNKYLSIITLNETVLNFPSKRHTVAEYIRKPDSHICCLQATHLRTKDIHRLKVEDWKKYSKQMDGGKKARVAIPISDKMDLKKGAIKRDPEDHFLILKGRIHQEDINIVNIYAPKIGAPKYIKKILEDFKKDVDNNTIIVGNFNNPLSKMDGFCKQNINKDIVAFNNVLHQMNLTDI